MNETDEDLGEKFLATYRKLTPENQQKVQNVVEFLTWLHKKRDSDLTDESNKSEAKNDHQS